MKQFQKKENINVLSLRAILQKNDKERNLSGKKSHNSSTKNRSAPALVGFTNNPYFSYNDIILIREK